MQNEDQMPGKISTETEENRDRKKRRVDPLETEVGQRNEMKMPLASRKRHEKNRPARRAEEEIEQKR